MKKISVILSALLLVISGGCTKKNEIVKVDVSSVYSDAVVTEIKDYIKANNPDVTDDLIDPQITNMKNFIKAAENIGADLNSAYDEALKEDGVSEEIADLTSQGIPESYLKFDMYTSLATEAIVAHMEENNLFDDIDKEAYFKENYWRAKHVLVGTESTTDEEKKESYKLAQEILKRAESGDDFDALVAEYSEDPGSHSQPDGYVFTAGEMVPEFEDGTKNTEIGKFTLVETSYGYHVIKRLALDETPELYEQFYQTVEQSIEGAAKQADMEKFVLENC